MLEMMIPGMDHEKMEERRMKIEQSLAQVTAKVQMAEGSLNETLYWIHQTPDGMNQDEAERQIKSLDVELNGYHRNGGEELSEGDLSIFGEVEALQPVGAN